MARKRNVLFRKRHPPIGARPGTLIIAEDAPRPAITIIDYDEERVAEHVVDKPSDVQPFLAKRSVTWIDVQGLGDEQVLRELASMFDMHPLALEDVVNVPQRPKAEGYLRHLLIVTHMARLLEHMRIDREQVTVFVGDGHVLTFQERPGDVFGPVRDRIRQGRGLIRVAGADYLAYALVDTILDGYYPVLEALGDYLEELQLEVVTAPEPATLQKIYEVKRELLALRRAVWPQREMLNTMIRDESPFISETVRVYLRDCYDHCVQMMDVLETYREMAGGLLDIYLSSVSNRTNEVMKVLTIMASIFIPLTFIAGVYGMNFEFMPELHTRIAYPLVLVLMVSIAIGMLVYFRRLGWLQRTKKPFDEEQR